jgi:hypothetical protein
VTIPEVHIVLKRADAEPLVEVVVEYMTSTTQVGLDFLDTSFTLHCFNILDHSFRVVHNQAPLYPYLLETYIPGSQQRHL